MIQGSYIKNANKSYNKQFSFTVCLICLYFFLSPLEDVLSFGSSGTILKYLAIGIAFGVIVSEFTYKKSINIDKYFIFIVYLILLAWVSTVWALDSSVALSRNIAYTLLPALYIIVIKSKYTDKDMKLIDSAIVWGGVLTLVYIIITQGLTGIIAGRLVLTETSDPNGLAGRLMLSLLVAFKWFVETSSIYKKILYGLISVALMMACLLTGSRGAVLSIVVVVIVYFLFSPLKKKLKRLLFLFLFGLIIVFLINKYLPADLYERLFDVKSYNNAIKTSGQRGDIWKNVLQRIIPKMNFFGLGSGCGSVKLIEIYGHIKGVHNTYLNMILEYGIFGVTVFALFLFNIFKDCFKRKDIYRMCAMGGILAIAFFLDAYATKFFWNTLMYCSIGVSQTIIGGKKNGLATNKKVI